MFQDHLHLVTFQEKLENELGKKLKLKINDNRSTMLSVKWEADYTKVSLHKMFLQAPQNIMQALACYLKGEHKALAPSIKNYIEMQVSRLDYSHELDLSKLETKGKFHDIQKIYTELNQEYFDQSLNLFITWFGDGQKKKCNRFTFGLFHDPLRLIKINRMLDDRKFPEYLVSYVIYHEMVHYVCPAFVDQKGNKQIHGKEFKELEKKHKDFNRAQQWIRDHKNDIFNASF